MNTAQGDWEVDYQRLMWEAIDADRKFQEAIGNMHRIGRMRNPSQSEARAASTHYTSTSEHAGFTRRSLLEWVKANPYPPEETEEPPTRGLWEMRAEFAGQESQGGALSSSLVKTYERRAHAEQSFDVFATDPHRLSVELWERVKESHG